MADIQLHQFVDADLPASVDDYIYLSQNSSARKVKISDLADQFELVDIFGLLEITNPENGDFLPIVDISSGLDTESNRKVTFKTLSNYTQEAQHYALRSFVNESDDVIFLDNTANTQKRINVPDLRQDILDFQKLGTVAPSDADLVCFQDTSETPARARKISVSGLRTKILNKSSFTTFNAENFAGEDFLYLYDDSDEQAKIVTYTGFFEKIKTDLTLSDYVDVSTNQDISGLKNFQNVTSFQSGISVGEISEIVPNLGVSIDGVTLKDGNCIGNLKPNPTRGSYVGSFVGTGRIFKDEPSNDALKSFYNNNAPLSVSNVNLIEIFGDNFGSSGSPFIQGGIVPQVSDKYTLGFSGREWAAIYASRAYFSTGISVRGKAYLPSNVFINGSSFFDNTGKVNSTFINPVVPVATNTTFGGIKLRLTGSTLFISTTAANA